MRSRTAFKDYATSRDYGVLDTDAASNLNHATGYQQHRYSLAAYAGQAITLKFTGAEDSEFQTSFVIDDTSLNVS